MNDLSIHGENSTTEKHQTISRSQSAASLNSLEQTTNEIHWFVLLFQGKNTNFLNLVTEVRVITALQMVSIPLLTLVPRTALFLSCQSNAISIQHGGLSLMWMA